MLAIAAITGDGLTLPADGFRAVSVVRGSGVVQIGPCQQAVSAHDHFGVPAGSRLRNCGRQAMNHSSSSDALLQTATTDRAAGGHLPVD